MKKNIYDRCECGAVYLKDAVPMCKKCRVLNNYEAKVIEAVKTITDKKTKIPKTKNKVSVKSPKVARQPKKPKLD